MINAFFRRIFYADTVQRPSHPETNNRQDRRMFPEIDTVIAHRAERLCNRDRALVAKYVRVQTILSRGR